MITPAFDLSQDPEYLIVNICVPYTRTSEFDLYIDGTDLKFFAKPYFLRWDHQTDARGGMKAIHYWVYKVAPSISD